MTNKPDNCREAFEARFPSRCATRVGGQEIPWQKKPALFVMLEDAQWEAYKAAHDAQQAKIDRIKIRLVQIASGDWRNGDDSAEALALDALKHIKMYETISTKESDKDG